MSVIWRARAPPPDRDTFAVHHYSRRAAGLRGRRGFFWNSGLHRATIFAVPPGRFDSVPRISADFARALPFAVNPQDFEWWDLAGWRIAVVRGTPGAPQILRAILAVGPGPLGFVRVGDTFVPESLNFADRIALARYVRA